MTGRWENPRWIRKVKSEAADSGGKKKWNWLSGQCFGCQGAGGHKPSTQHAHHWHAQIPTDTDSRSFSIHSYFCPRRQLRRLQTSSGVFYFVTLPETRQIFWLRFSVWHENVIIIMSFFFQHSKFQNDVTLQMMFQEHLHPCSLNWAVSSQHITAPGRRLFLITLIQHADAVVVWTSNKEVVSLSCQISKCWSLVMHAPVCDFHFIVFVLKM